VEFLDRLFAIENPPLEEKALSYETEAYALPLNSITILEEK
jgi:hypothetical protein